MTYNCVILPEYFENNNFFNYKGGKEGCPIDRALFEAGDPLNGQTYAYDNGGIIHMINNQLREQRIDSRVINIFMNKEPKPERIEFTIVLPD